jgi:enoyl-CoA hydratase/carnithine racemase
LRELNNIERDNDQQVIIICSEGEIFSTGQDLKELLKGDEAFRRDSFEKCYEIMLKMKNSKKVYIGEIQGLAAAGGCQLALSCDLLVASSLAKFQTPIKYGLFCTTPGIPLGRLVSSKRALYMLTTGELIDAKTALKWGLVNQVIEIESDFDKEKFSQKLRQETLTLADVIIKNLQAQSLLI